MEPGLLQRLQETIDLVLSLPFQVRLWEAQNTYYRMMRDVRRAGAGASRARRRGSPSLAGGICQAGRKAESEISGYVGGRRLPDTGRYEWEPGGHDSLDGFDWVRDKSFKNAVVAFITPSHAELLRSHHCPVQIILFAVVPFASQKFF